MTKFINFYRTEIEGRADIVWQKKRLTQKLAAKLGKLGIKRIYHKMRKYI
jgi:hypothetical protein